MSFKNYYLALIYSIKDLMQDNNLRKQMIKLRTRLRLNYSDVVCLFSQRMNKKVKELNPNILKIKVKLLTIIEKIEKIHNINKRNLIGN
jgi:hypothetical protein